MMGKAGAWVDGGVIDGTEAPSRRRSMNGGGKRTWTSAPPSDADIAQWASHRKAAAKKNMARLGLRHAEELADRAVAAAVAVVDEPLFRVEFDRVSLARAIGTAGGWGCAEARICVSSTGKTLMDIRDGRIVLSPGCLGAEVVPGLEVTHDRNAPLLASLARSAAAEAVRTALRISDEAMAETEAAWFEPFAGILRRERVSMRAPSPGAVSYGAVQTSPGVDDQPNDRWSGTPWFQRQGAGLGIEWAEDWSFEPSSRAQPGRPGLLLDPIAERRGTGRRGPVVDQPSVAIDVYPAEDPNGELWLHHRHGGEWHYPQGWEKGRYVTRLKAGEVIAELAPQEIRWGALGRLAMEFAVGLPEAWVRDQAAQAYRQALSVVSQDTLALASRIDGLSAEANQWAWGRSVQSRGGASRLRLALAGSDKTRISRRLQALEAYPSIMGLLPAANVRVTGGEPWQSALMRKIEAAVDNGYPLAPTLAKAMDAPAPFVTALTKFKASACMDDRTGILAYHLRGAMRPEVVRFARAVPAEYLPGRGAGVPQWEWAGFVIVANLWCGMSRETPITPGHLWLGGAPWRNAGGFDDIKHLTGDTGALGDMLRDVTRYTAVLAVADLLRSLGEDYRTAPEMIAGMIAECRTPNHPLSVAVVGKRGFRALVEVSQRWHRGLPGLEDAVLRASGERRGDWLPLTAAPVEVEGLHITPLASELELRIEGRRMEHCVGSYAARSAAGHSHIVSLRTADGTPLSTAEVEVRRQPGGRYEIRVAQHSGRRNAAPPAQAKAAMNAWSKGIAEGDITLAPRLAAQRRWGMTDTTEVVGQRHPLDPRIDTEDQAVLDAVWEAYRSYLPRDYRSCSRPEWLVRSGLAAAVHETLDARRRLWLCAAGAPPGGQDATPEVSQRETGPGIEDTAQRA